MESRRCDLIKAKEKQKASPSFGSVRYPQLQIFADGYFLINRPFSNIEKRSVNSAFSLCERQENIRGFIAFMLLKNTGVNTLFSTEFSFVIPTGLMQCLKEVFQV